MNKSRQQLLEGMLENEPDDAFLNYAIALEFVKNNQVEKAIHILEKVISVHPDYLASYYQLGKLYEQNNLSGQAKKIYECGVEVAKKQNNIKTLNELNEAIFLLE
jgi:Tfp pilus assembly protein PilF